jgi:hypothetical protein
LNSHIEGVEVSAILEKPTEGRAFTRDQVKWLNKGGSLNEYVQNRIKNSQNMPYIEAQIRGLLTTSHIESIGVPKQKVYGGYWSGTKKFNSNAEKEANTIAKKLSACVGRKTEVVDAGNHYLVKFID